MKLPALLRLAACALVSCCLAACGGGGGGNEDSDGGTSAWTPATTDSWTIQLTGTPDTALAVRVYDLDLFDTPQATIASLQAQGRAVVCYFSAGSAEDWREDYASFTAADKGHALDGWPGENWLDTRSANVRSIMVARLQLARDKGCDAVDPDNVDGWSNDTGFALDAASQLDYNRFLATQAHALGLKVGLKNDVGQLAALAPDFDFAINEQCFFYAECDGYAAFTGSGKPVFNIEYDAAYVNNTAGARDQLCAAARAADIRTLVMAANLDGSLRLSCD
ncbi:endo alpha-1,4 polygalactosaminidase [Rubrivivax gelatinosus]|uniref:endo alpha-1,4 polygalactosaminidase n=1 Tax=Rubrivivax gelatinosus TaxID=28068 RepID=UPI001902D4C2|nr:endo alpha-1,4 polygalactosaminidase [Rubrivivax gelatinosus]MBK1615039.1 endo alpha-1,4 polygalactosaminidase [Rubrivivax gelatinosus]